MIFRSFRVSVVTLAVASVSSVFAAEPWEEAPFAASAPQIRAALSALPVPADADVEVLLDEAHYDFDAQHRVTVRRRLVYRVLTAQGARKWATTEAAWQPWHEARPEFRSRVITSAGAVYELDPATLTEQSVGSEAPETFSDTKIVRGPLPAMEVGAFVEEQILSRDNAPMFSKGSVYRYFFGKDVPVRRTVLKLTAPADSHLKYVMRNATPKVSDTRSGGKRTVLIEKGPTAVEEPAEPFAPRELAVYGHVAFTTSRSWAEVAAEYGKIVDRQLAETDLQPLAKEIFGGTGKLSREKALHAVLNWMRAELRYTGIEFGEAALVPRTPAEVLTRKYGDCKDLATLVVGLLRTRGIDAQVALLRTNWDEVPESVPGIGLFDHAIVHVPGSPALWLDATSTAHPVGELPLADQGRLALIASGKTTKLVRIPESAPSANRSEVVREIHLSEDGPAKIIERRKTQGSIAAGYRQAAADNEAGAIRDWYQNFVREGLGAKELTAFEYPMRPPLDQPFAMSLEIAEASQVTTADQEVTANLAISSLLGWLPDALVSGSVPKAEPEEGTEETPRKPEHVKRRHDFELLEPYQAQMEYRIVPPPGFVARAVPETADTRKLGPATVSRSFKQLPDGTVIAAYRFDVGKRRYSAAEVEAFRAEYARWSEESQDQVVFEHEGKQHLAAGRFREALDAYRRVAALHPAEALHEIHLARALLDAGFGDDARAHARRAVSLQPTNAVAHQMLGWILQHDPLGRRFSKGFDLAGSIAAYRKAKELGGSFEARGDLAILLEHNARGERYAKDADLEGAIAEYRALRTELERQELDQNLFYALLWAGKFAELKTETTSAKETPARNALKVVAVAALEGAGPALAEVNRIERTNDGRRKVTFAAAEQLVKIRRYTEAAALLKEASKGSKDAAAQQTRIALISKVKRHEELNATAKDPKGAVQRAMIRMFDPETTAEQLGTLFSKRTSQGTPTSKLGAQLLEVMVPQRRKMAQQGVGLLVAVDSALSAMELAVDGEDSVGHRVRVSVPLQNTRQESWFLVKEDGEYRILASSRTPEVLGVEALRLAQAGQLSAARRWLNWARELASCGGEVNAWSTFCAVWPENGKSEDKGVVTLAAASMVALTDRPDAATDTLEKARATASPDLAAKLDWTLAGAYFVAGKRFEALNATLDRIIARDGQTTRSFVMKVQALALEEKRQEARALADRRLAEHPGDALALSQLMVMDLRAGDYAAGIARGEQLISTGSATANTYNELAWTALFHGGVDERAVEYAQRAAAMSGNGNRAILHTLASVNAEVGKNVEARQLLLTSIEMRVDDEPDPADWYVIGRIAENYALHDTARAAYQKTLATKEDAKRPGSVELLARERLEKLSPSAVAGPTPP